MTLHQHLVKLINRKKAIVKMETKLTKKIISILKLMLKRKLNMIKKALQLRWNQTRTNWLIKSSNHSQTLHNPPECAITSSTARNISKLRRERRSKY